MYLQTQILTEKEAQRFLRRDRKYFWITVKENKIPFVKEVIRGKERKMFRLVDLENYINSKLHIRG